MDFIVPDCQIRKVDGRIYGGGDRIPNYSEEEPKIVELEVKIEKPKKRSKRDTELNDLFENISVAEAENE